MNKSETIFMRLQLAMDEFRRVYPEAGLLTFQVFLTVAQTPGVSGQDLLRRVGASQSSVSRQLLLLSEMTWHGKKPGLDLVEAIADPNDRRGKLSYLTNKGRSLAATIARTIEPACEVTAADFPLARDHRT